MKTFSPYACAVSFGAVEGKGLVGINWSTVAFSSNDDRAKFIVECDKHGCRTRNLYIGDDGFFYVQYRAVI